VLAEALKQKGEVEELQLFALDESKTFLGQCQRAFKHARAKIQEVNCDLSRYDLICFGTPVWAFGPAPALNTYLDKCFGASGKDVILFATYGSGAGKERCLDYIQKILSAKGVSNFKRFSIQQSKVNKKDFIIAEITKLNLSQ